MVAPAFRGTDGIVVGLHNAHVLNAWVMSSACIPAFLLARRVTGRRWPAYALALVTVCTPWIVYATTLLTEVVGYPAFTWALPLSLLRWSTLFGAKVTPLCLLTLSGSIQ